jgi:hypothetical protein
LLAHALSEKSARDSSSLRLQLQDYWSGGDFAEFTLSERGESNGLGMTETQRRQFLCFSRCDWETVCCDRLLELNAESGGSVDSFEICELSGSAVSEIWEG